MTARRRKDDIMTETPEALPQATNPPLIDPTTGSPIRMDPAPVAAEVVATDPPTVPTLTEQLRYGPDGTKDTAPANYRDTAIQPDEPE